jgi:putative membrane protein insertion efficiency factor
MDALGRAVWLAPRRALVAAVRWYQRTVSPLTPPSCRFTPTCSSYAAEALGRYGVVYGGLLALWRIARCHPLGGHGWDPPRPFGVAAPPAPWDDAPGGPAGGTDRPGPG